MEAIIIQHAGWLTLQLARSVVKHYKWAPRVARRVIMKQSAVCNLVIRPLLR